MFVTTVLILLNIQQLVAFVKCLWCKCCKVGGLVIFRNFLNSCPKIKQETSNACNQLIAKLRLFLGGGGIPLLAALPCCHPERSLSFWSEAIESKASLPAPPRLRGHPLKTPDCNVECGMCSVKWICVIQGQINDRISAHHHYP
jgi:hypothetical protein